MREILNQKENMKNTNIWKVLNNKKSKIKKKYPVYSKLKEEHEKNVCKILNQKETIKEQNKQARKKHICVKSWT